MLIRKKNITAVVMGVVMTVGSVGPIFSFAAPASRNVDVFVVFDGTPGRTEQAAVRGFGGNIRHSYHLVPAVAASIPESSLSALSRHPLVRTVEFDGIVHAIDAELDNAWGVQRIGAGSVHNAGNTGAGVRVAVIDSGIDYTHPDLASNYAGGYDFVNNDSDPMDDDGHGTHVAGTIAALDNGTGVVGVSPQAAIYALKVLDADGSGSWSNIVAALQWAVDNGIQVTNNSYGGSQNPGSTVEAAFANAETAGIFHAAAAGNSGNPAGKGNNVGYPARYASVIAVAATDASDTRAWFSSTGDQVELSAPGVLINSTKLGGGYVEFNGTSMASPHVAGTAVLVIAAGIADTSGNGRINDEVRQTLNATAQDLGKAAKDEQYGHGLIQAAVAVASVTSTPSPSPSPSPSTTPAPSPTPSPLPSPGGVAVVSSITYATEGGKNSNAHLLTTLTVVDDIGNAVSGATVSIDLNRNGSRIASGTGMTGTNGKITFKLRNAAPGCYATDVTSLAATGFAWDGMTPPNGFCK